MTKLLRILHLEDSPADAELVEHVLCKAGFDVTLLRVESHTDFVAGLESLQPDIILADYSLPTFDGMQALAIAREKYPLTPFIFVTGMMGEEASIQILKNGASDYIIKDRLTRLPNAIRQALEKQKEIARRIQSEQDLLASEKKFRTIFESSADAILLQDDHGFIDCNPAALKLFGCASRNDLIGQHPARISARTQAGGEDSLSLADQIIAKALKSGIQRFEWTCRRLDGVEFVAEILVVVIEIDSRKILHVTVRDITGHKIRQTKVQRLTNFFAALSQINQTILRCSSEAELFPKICCYLVQYGGMKMAWVGMVDEVTRQLNPVASYGEGEGILQGIQISVVADDSGSHEPIGASFRKDQIVLCQDCQHDTAAEVWQKYATQYGWGSSASLPLHRKGVPVGVLSLYAETVNAFDEEACKLLAEMAIDVSFALDIFAREAERILNVAVLKDSEQRFRTLIEQSIAGVYIIQGGKFTYVNPRFVEILGYSATDELLDRDPLKIIASKDCNRVEKQLNKLIKKEVLSDSYVCSMLHKDGKLVDVGMNSSIVTYQGSPAIIGLMQDLTDKKIAEEQIKYYASQLQITFMQTVGLVTTLSEMRDPYTAGHERRVADIAVAIGKELGLDDLQLEGLKVGGYLHDVGKTTIPVEILTKPGKITAIEYELIKVHPQSGYNVLKDVDFPWPVAQIALQHHERLDGSGYPQGLKGDDILFEARIIAIADVIEAMASHRPYREGLGVEVALAEIERGRGSVYDPVIADTCLMLFRNKGYVLPN